ncbi:MAG: glycosyltransferase family A protein, partial [Pseudomonadota bacterium]
MAGRHVETLKRIYRRMPSGVRESIPDPVETWLRSRFATRIRAGRPGEVVRNLDRKLWGGFSTSALRELEIELAEANPTKGKFAEATFVLAAWHSVQGDFERAVALMETLRENQPHRIRERRFHLVHALYLCRVGRAQDARALLDAVGPRKHFDTSHALVEASVWSPEAGATEDDAGDHALAAINSIFKHYGLAELSRFDPNKPVSLDNLSAADAPASRNGDLVSVIVPLWNAENTVGTAMRGLAAQTHTDIEVLIVDDCSTDNSAEVVADFCARDPRFRLIRQEQNGGAYMARNRALAEANGTFITVHDSDDWSHPERIARHLDDLQPRFVPFNISDWVRTSTDLCFWGPWRPQPNQPTRNFSSVFFHRDLIDKVGPWDAARVSADREFINRVQSLHGLKRQLAFLPGCPLALGRLEDTSLTRTGATHAATMYHGIRRDYHEAGDLWHDELRQLSKVRGGLDGLNLSDPPYFPAPASIKPDRGADAREDILFVGDYNFNGGTQKSALNMISAAREAGFRTAMLQYRRYDQDVARRLNPDVRRFAWNNDVRIVAPGEKLRAETVVVTY